MEQPSIPVNPPLDPRFPTLFGRYIAKKPCGMEYFPVLRVRQTQGYPTVRLNRNRALFVGDSSIEVATARNADVAVWALPYGYNRGQPIEACTPDRVIADCFLLLS